MVDDRQPATPVQRFRGGPQHPGAVQGERGVEVLRGNQVEGSVRKVVGEVDAERGDGLPGAVGPLPERVHR
jgi:hypothetical protein